MTRRLAADLFGSQTQRRRRRGIALSHVSVEPLEVRCLPSAVIELVADLNSTPRDQHDQSSALPAQLTVGGLTFFATQTSYHGDTLWRTDGSDVGTFAVLGGSPHTGDRRITNLWSAGDKLYFQTNDRSSGAFDLWVSDGTNAGTQRLRSWQREVFSLSGLGDVVTFGAGAGARFAARGLGGN